MTIYLMIQFLSVIITLLKACLSLVLFFIIRLVWMGYN